MKTCENCKYWGASDTVSFDLEEYIKNNTEGKLYGKCERIPHGFWQTQYENANYEYCKPTSPLKPAFTIDGSDYHSELNTIKDFGCILFEGTN